MQNNQKDREERLFVVIDGSNFYHRLKELSLKGNFLKFDYKAFAQWLEGSRMVIEKKYYIGIIRAKPDDVKG